MNDLNRKHRLSLWLRIFLKQHSLHIYQELLSMISLNRACTCDIGEAIINRLLELIDRRMMFVLERVSNEFHLSHEQINSQDNYTFVYNEIVNTDNFTYRRVNKMINSSVKYILKTLRIIDCDFQKNENINIESKIIHDIKFLANSDFDFNEAKVIIITSPGCGLVYSPCHYEFEQFVALLYDKLQSAEGRYVYDRAFIKSRVHGEYTNYLKPYRKPLGISALVDCYYDLGRLTAFSMAIGMPDRHEDNFIVTENGVLQIDFENAFSNSDIAVAGYCQGYGFCNKTGDHRNAKYYRSIFDDDMSYYLSYRPVFLSYNPIEIGYEKRERRVADYSFPLGDKLYRKTFWNGFKSLHSQISVERHGIIDIIVETVCHNPLSQRVIFNNITFYRMALMFYEKEIVGKRSPQPLTNRNWFSQISKREIKYNERIVAIEATEIMNYRIPKFYRMTNTNDLFYRDATVIKEYFDMQFIGIVEKKLSNLPSFDEIQEHIELELLGIAKENILK